MMSSDKSMPEDSMNKDEQPKAQSSTGEPSENGISIGRAAGSSSRYSAMSIPASPPKQVTIDQLAEATKNFYNMSLVHEISVDSNFKVSKNEEPFERILRETMHKAFWDIQRSHLEANPPNYEPAIGMMKEIRQMLEGLTLPHQTTLRAQIAANLDIESAEEEWRSTGRLRLESFAEPLVDMLAQWCAPVRDPDVARLRSISDPIEFFRQAFALLELMHMDLANFTIQEMRPYIRQQAGQYEREKFDSLLEVQRNAGIDGLAITRSWIHEAYVKLHNTSSESQITPNNILREAYLALLTWPDDHDLPETVTVDAKRIYELSNCLGRTVTLASLILVVCNAVASATSNGSLSLKTPNINDMTPQSPPISTLKAAVSRDARGIVDAVPVSKLPQLSEVLKLRMLFVIENWQKSISEAGSSKEGPNSLPEAFKEQVAGQIDSVLTREHPVYKLMFSRALDFLRSTLSARPPNPIQLPTGFGCLSESASSSSSMNQTSVSMDPSVCALERPSITRVVKQDMSSSSDPNFEHFPDDLSRVYDLALIASRLMPLVAHNRHVFGPHYAEIIQCLLKPPHPTQSSE
ncbi:unnamed protein product [Hymenolepis diminuta]|uniref:T-complex protein 11-like protein 1 n=2 Tax=Hymenolepis diminuta TaxID=6216 RepID=A0A564YAP7_HYMDI|nr:unnamed protein product [Hymenolepis diminuta]